MKCHNQGQHCCYHCCCSCWTFAFTEQDRLPALQCAQIDLLSMLELILFRLQQTPLLYSSRAPQETYNCRSVLHHCCTRTCSQPAAAAGPEASIDTAAPKEETTALTTNAPPMLWFFGNDQGEMVLLIMLSPQERLHCQSALLPSCLSGHQSSCCMPATCAPLTLPQTPLTEHGTQHMLSTSTCYHLEAGAASSATHCVDQLTPYLQQLTWQKLQVAAALSPVVPSSVHSPPRLHLGPVLLCKSSTTNSYSKPSAVATTRDTCSAQHSDTSHSDTSTAVLSSADCKAQGTLRHTHTCTYLVIGAWSHLR